jgi:hypothetical protein
MRSHVHQIGLKGILRARDDNLLNPEGEPIENYTLVFRELFCVAAADLAASLHRPLEKLGVLYDEMMSTGKGAEERDSKSKKIANKGRKSAVSNTSADDLELESLGTSGKGQLLFLVNRAGRRDADSFLAAGYRFANIPQVISILANSLQVKPGPLTRRLDIMREYANEPHMLEAGVHIAIFAIRASLGGGRHGFDILARRDAKNQLPTMLLSPDALEDWQLDYIKRMDALPLSLCLKTINKTAKASNPSKKEQAFAKLLLTTLEALKDEIEDPFVNDALLIGRPIDAPCRALTPEAAPDVAQLICFTIIVPIHGRAPGKKLMFESLNFFNMQQHVYPKSPDHAAFAKKTYHEYKNILNLGPGGIITEGNSFSSFYNMRPNSSGMSRHKSGRLDHVEELGEAPELPPRIPKIKFWDRSSHAELKSTTNLASGSDEAPIANQNPFVKDADMKKNEGSRKNAAEEEERDQKTYVDELFALTISSKGTVR